jgi:hypothetical protein
VRTGSTVWNFLILLFKIFLYQKNSCLLLNFLKKLFVKITKKFSCKFFQNIFLCQKVFMFVDIF